MKKSIVIVLYIIVMLVILDLCFIGLTAASTMANICGFVGFMFVIIITVELINKFILKKYEK